MRIVDKQSLLAERRQGTRETDIEYVLNGKVETVKKRIVDGEMDLPRLDRPLGELITFGGTEQHRDLLRKVVLDVELGREFQPLVYAPIYENLEDPNFPRVIDAKWALQGTVTFLEWVEGQEVRFGRVEAVSGPTARIVTWVAGFEYTKEMREFNEAFRVEMLNRNLGEAHNALLNHIHLSPIFTHTYVTANQTAWIAPPANQPRWVGIYNTVTAAATAAATARRPGSVLLANSALRPELDLALRGGHNLGGTQFPPIAGIETVVYYTADDAWGYPSPPANRAYLIRPRRGFKELVKQDLRIESQTGDLSRLVEEQIVGYTHRGVFAAVPENVQEITIG